MNDILMLLAAAFGIALGGVIGIGVLVPAVGKATAWPGNPHRIANPCYRRLATRMWGAMACALVLVGGGQLVWTGLLLALGGVCACAAFMFGMRLRASLAHESHVRRVQQEAAFRDELEQVLRSER